MLFRNHSLRLQNQLKGNWKVSKVNKDYETQISFLTIELEGSNSKLSQIEKELADSKKTEDELKKFKEENLKLKEVLDLLTAKNVEIQDARKQEMLLIEKLKVEVVEKEEEINLLDQVRYVLINRN